MATANVESLPGEIWKDIPGFDAYYQVSNHGRVRSHQQSGPHPRYPNFTRTVLQKLMKLKVATNGYMMINLTVDKVQTTHCVHKLVCAAFFGPRPYKIVINHKDGVKANNILINLEYVTYSENSKHAFSMGLTHSNRRRCNCLLSDDQVRDMRRLYSEGTKMTDIAKRFNYNHQWVRGVVNGKKYKWVK